MAYESPIFSVLDSLNDGRIIQRVVSVSIRIAGAAVLVGGAIGVITMVGLTFRLSSSADVTVGGVLYAMLLGAVSIAVFEIFRYRARAISAIGSSPYTVFPVISSICRLGGEVYATILVGLGAGGLLLNLFGAGFLGSQGLFGGIPFLPGSPSSGLVGGGGFAVLMGLLAFLTLVVSYFFAEAIGVATDIARNVATLVRLQQSPQATASAVTAAAAVTALGAASGPADRDYRRDTRPERDDPHDTQPTAGDALLPSRCPNCLAENPEPENVFCLNCGARLTPSAERRRDR